MATDDIDNTTAAGTGTTLYYPYIHPRDIDSLKAALLYWDRVRRIIPPSVRDGVYAYEDTEDTRRLAECRLLVTTEPEPYEDAAATRFFEHLGSHTEKFRISLEEARSLARRNRGIHIEKLGHGVLWRLQELGLAQQFGEWVSMHDEVGALYMFCLASEISDRMAAPLLADSLEDAHLGESMLFEAREDTNTTDRLLRAMLNFPSPQQLTQVAISDICDFATRRAGERRRFRKAVSGIIDVAKDVADPNALLDYLETQRSEITEAVDDHRATLDELGVGAAHGLSQITVPAGIGAALVAFPVSPVAAGIIAAVGLTISAVACYAETRGKLREAKTSSPYHYLVSIEREITSTP